MIGSLLILAAFAAIIAATVLSSGRAPHPQDPSCVQFVILGNLQMWRAGPEHGAEAQQRDVTPEVQALAITSWVLGITGRYSLSSDTFWCCMAMQRCTLHFLDMTCASKLSQVAQHICCCRGNAHMIFKCYRCIDSLWKAQRDSDSELLIGCQHVPQSLRQFQH
jgi:hypothetical protein